MASASLASALQAEGHRFEPCSSHIENQAVMNKTVTAFLFAQALHKQKALLMS